ncbi:hypothetical protein D3C78_1929270 [compost metagenome]
MNNRIARFTIKLDYLIHTRQRRNIQPPCDPRTYLSGISINGHFAANNQVNRLHRPDLLDRLGE